MLVLLNGGVSFVEWGGGEEDARRRSSLCLVRRGGAESGYHWGGHRARRYRLVGRKGGFSH